MSLITQLCASLTLHVRRERLLAAQARQVGPQTLDIQASGLAYGGKIGIVLE